MQGILEFIQQELKIKHTTVSKFIKDNKYSRTSFYRMMNNPELLDEADILKLCSALGLSESKEQDLRRCIKISGSTVSEDDFAAAQDIIFNPPAFIDYRASDVEFFSSDPARNKTIRGYYDIINDIDFSAGTQIKIKILNCISEAAVTSLYVMLTALRKRYIDHPDSNIDVIIEHAAQLGALENISVLEALRSLLYVFQFDQYSFTIIDFPSDSPLKGQSLWRTLSNTVLIQERHNDAPKKNRYLLFYLTNSLRTKDACYESFDRGLYHFGKAAFSVCRSLTPPHLNFSFSDATATNEQMSRNSAFKKLVMYGEPCIDAFHPHIIRKAMKNIFSKPTLAANLRNRTDPQGRYSYMTNEHFFKIQTELLRKRFYDNETNAAINVYDCQSFARFLETGIMYQIGGIVVLNTEERISFLAYLISRISNYYGDKEHQQFYFFSASSRFHNFFSVYTGAGVGLTSPFTGSSTNFFPFSELSYFMYDVVSSSLGGRILSKEDSLDFLRERYFLLGGTSEALERDAKMYDRAYRIFQKR